MQQPTKYLIIAWGNPARGDDAAGLVIADALECQASDHVTIRCFHQLGPELAEDVAAADCVIFIDAHVHPQWPDLVVQEVDPATDYSPDSHSSGPEELVALAKVLYHHQPKAWLVATRAYDTTFGAGLSDKGQELVAAALKVVRGMLPAASGSPSVQS